MSDFPEVEVRDPVQVYADLKKIPVKALESFGVWTEKGAVAMQYLDEDGDLFRVRYRGTGLPKFWWGEGEGQFLYGIERLQDGPVVLVEGESDCHAAWFNNINALGVPGATSWRHEWTRYLADHEVFIWQEPGDAGKEFVARIGDSIPDAMVLTPAGYIKDLSELHVHEGADTSMAFNEMLKGAKPVDLQLMSSRGRLAPLDRGHAYDLGRRGKVVEAATYAPEPMMTTPASEITEEKVTWLWDGRIARGSLNGLVGHGGLGKSTLSLDIAARITRGGVMPQDAEGVDPSDVLIISAEDHAAAVITPRLRIANAALERAHVLSVDDVPYHLAMAGELEATIEATNAVLVIIDPVSAFLGGIDSYRDSDYRQLLAPLKVVAERTGAAILFIAHLKKGEGGPALHKIAGSIGLGAALRLVLLVDEDPDDPNNRVLVPLKSNLARMPRGQRFSINSSEVDPAIAQVGWGAPIDMSADELFSRNSKRRSGDEENSWPTPPAEEVECQLSNEIPENLRTNLEQLSLVEE